MPAWVFRFVTTVPLLLGTDPGVPVTLTEPSVPTSMPYEALPVKRVCVPDGLLMFAAPPVTWMPSALEPLTTTPAPTVSVPAVTRMPSPVVFWMVTFEMLEVNVEVVGET